MQYSNLFLRWHLKLKAFCIPGKHTILDYCIQEFPFLHSLIYRFNASSSDFAHTQKKKNKTKNKKNTESKVHTEGLPRSLSGEESTCQCRRQESIPGSGWFHKPWESWTCAPGPGSHSHWAQVLQLLKPECSSTYAPQQEKPPWRQAWQLASGPCLSQLPKSLYSNRETA